MEDYERNSNPPTHGEDSDVRKAQWTEDEDAILVNFVSTHGHARWNRLACSSGLKRTGKSCRLRWVNYLCPDVKRGNITLEEQFTILKLHSVWGNRWSKIAQYLPGRTDNEIKNYWRTRVQKQAKQLRCDVNSDLFKETMRNVWMPRLMEKINSQSTPAKCEILESMITDLNSVEQGFDQFNPVHYHQQFVPASELAPTSSNTPAKTISNVHGRVVNGSGYEHVVQTDFGEFSDWDCAGGDTMWTDNESFGSCWNSSATGQHRIIIKKIYMITIHNEKINCVMHVRCNIHVAANSSLIINRRRWFY